jgi:hypothetical protein
MRLAGRRVTGALVLALVLAGAAAPAAAAQEDARLAQLDPAALAAIRPELDTAAAAGLPAEPLVLRALEGANRGAAPDRIAAAVRSLRLRLVTAREAIGARSTESEYVAAAGALAAGVPVPVLVGMRRERRAGSLDVPLVVVSDLVARGVPPADASATVTELLGRGADDRTLLSLRTTVQQDIAQGATPRTAAESRARGILAALPPLRPTPATTSVKQQP